MMIASPKNTPTGQPETANGSHVAAGNGVLPGSAPGTGVGSAVTTANAELLTYMMGVLQDGRAEARALYGRLRWSYWLLIGLSVTVFGVGIALLSSPLWLLQLPGVESLGANFNWFATFFPPALGLANLLGLYLYKPMQRINRLMGAMTQLIVILNQYHIRIALRLVECEIDKRSTVGAAADNIKPVAAYALSSIERYFGKEMVDPKVEEKAGEGTNGSQPAVS